MSKKEQLLTETQVRQFMKLANLQPLTPGFVNGLSETHPDWGMGKRDKSSSDPGEEDYTWRKGRKSKTHRGVDLKETGPWQTQIEYEKRKEDDVKESHGRGRGEGAAGHGKPDDNGRAGARLREVEIDEDIMAPGTKTPGRKEDKKKRRRDEDMSTSGGSTGPTNPAYRDDEDEWENAEDDLDHAEDLEVDAEEDLGDIGDEAAMGGGREVSVDDFLAALEVALEDVLGDEVEVDQEDDVEEEEVADLGLENGDEIEMEMGAVEEDPALQEMISTITKRVAKRIVKEALKKKK